MLSVNAHVSKSQVALAILLLAILGLPLSFHFDSTATSGFYDGDNDHAWNRLHETLVVRHAADDRRFGDGELDPLVWANSKHLFSGAAYEQAILTLDGFLADHAHELIDDPLKRAVLQHDLWGLFDWLADPDCQEYSKQRRGLRRRIAQIIRRIALPANVIQQLPDNYAAVVEPRRFVERNLPPNLYDSDGSWIQLAYEKNGRIGTAHEENTATQGRSAFLMFIRLPQTDCNFDEVLAAINRWADRESLQDDETRRRSDYPSYQLPEGTQVALVRRMLVIDDQGIIKPTNITERIQLRSFVKSPQAGSKEISPQVFQLFTLNRRELLSGRLSRSLQPVNRREKGFELGPIRTPVNGDPFESQSEPPTVLMTSCAQCHKHHGLLALSRDGFSYLGTRPTSLRLEAKSELDAQPTANWKSSRSEFALLQELVTKVEPFGINRLGSLRGTSP